MKTNKHCYKCGETKPISEFYTEPSRYDGVSQRCRLCMRTKSREQRERNKESHRARNRRYYQANRETALDRSKRWAVENQHKVKAHAAVRKALKEGSLSKPEGCEVCGVLPIDAHHEDYQKPLEVKWLCRMHHMRAHDA